MYADGLGKKTHITIQRVEGVAVSKHGLGRIGSVWCVWTVSWQRMAGSVTRRDFRRVRIDAEAMFGGRFGRLGRGDPVTPAGFIPFLGSTHGSAFGFTAGYFPVAPAGAWVCLARFR